MLLYEMAEETNLRQNPPFGQTNMRRTTGTRDLRIASPTLSHADSLSVFSLICK